MDQQSVIDRTPPQFDYDAFTVPDAVDFEFILNPHGSRQDLPPAKELDELIRGFDIVIPELASSTDLAPTLNRVARGDLKAYQAMRTKIADVRLYKDWVETYMASLYNSRTHVTTADGPWTMRAAMKFIKSEDRRRAQMQRATTNAHVLATRNGIIESLAAIRERDQIILEKIGPRIGSLVMANRKLTDRQQRQGLRCGVFYGTGHSSLYQALQHKIATSETTSTVSLSPYSGGESNGIVRLYDAYLTGHEITDAMIIDMEARTLITAILKRKTTMAGGRLSTTALGAITNNLVAALDEAGSFASYLEVANILHNFEIETCNT